MRKVEVGQLHVFDHADGKRVELTTPDKLEVGEEIFMQVKGEKYGARVLECLERVDSCDYRYRLGS